MTFTSKRFLKCTSEFSVTALTAAQAFQIELHYSGQWVWHKVIENRKPVHPSSPLCQSLLQMCTGTHTLKPAALCVCVTGMLQRQPTIEDFVDALVSELNPNFETFIMDSESWKVPCGAMETDSNHYQAKRALMMHWWTRGGRHTRSRAYILCI